MTTAVKMHVKKGDTVVVLSGKDKGKQGKIVEALPKKAKVVIEGINKVKRHTKPSQSNPQGGIIVKEAAMSSSKVMVFQNPDNQIVAAIVEEDVAFGPENIGVPHAEIRPRVEAALAAVNMTEYAKHAPHLLSGGQKQRIAIAGVLALLPQCIVFDEPTAMLDPRGRKDIVNIVLKLNKEQKITIIYITHKMEEAILADRVIAMENGKIVMNGTPAEVFGQVKKIRQLGLEAPLPAEVAEALRQCGHELNKDIITDEELAAALCQ